MADESHTSELPGGWNYAEIWERVADRIPDAQALVQGDRRITWHEFDRHADGLARLLLSRGVDEQDKVAVYLYNCPEYLETMFACFKAGLVPVNTNYRYGPEELTYLWNNSDSVAVVFHGTFAETVEKVRDRVGVKTWIWVDDGTGPCPEWAIPYQEALEAAGPSRTRAEWGRSGDHLNFIYTGGTTGMPKGVMWRQDDLVRATVGTVNPTFRDGPATLEKVDRAVGGPGMVQLPACPLMHGTGQFTSLIFLSLGGSVVTLTKRNFDVEEMLETIARERVNALAIVGDAFAKPMLEALEREPERWDISSLITITSSGVMWSEEVKKGLLRFNPNMMLIDVFSSSEALGMGQSVSGGGGTFSTAKFVLGENARVITDDGRDVVPGSGEVGRVAVKGHQPIGYYKDEEKTKATFIELDGERWSVPGDYATVEADGTITLLGRGSQCINTAGEKVFPEEVEEVLKLHPDVHDAAVVGLPDERWGQSVNAVVELERGATLDEAALIEHVKKHLAGYKAPKRVVPIDRLGRAPNGKVDYKRLREYAARELGVRV
ncbi:MAG: acyl-CoA synthetase [Acidimicrobiales bacterium]|nr:MAG: acyl-CoA synthetase [Acidimicrobiales bacterium]